MTQDAYAAPKARLPDAAAEDHSPALRRPALVWLTQVLLVVFCLAMAAGALLGMAAVLSRSNVPGWRVAVGLAIALSELALPAWLFYGLAYRRRWAWHGGIAFSVLLLVITLWSRAHPAPGPLPQFEIKPNQMLGAAIGELTVTALLVLYPIRMFFSSKVRAFLGVRPFRQRGTQSAPRPVA